MTELLIRLLAMSFTAGCIVPVVLVLRFLMKKLPKGFSYALWFVVLFRFLCPVSLPSPFSLLPIQPEPVLQKVLKVGIPEPAMNVFEGNQAGGLVVNPAGEKPPAKTEAAWAAAPVRRVSFVMAVVWVDGMIFLLIYGLFRCYRLRLRLATAIRREKGVYESDQISGAFLTGIIRPAIYLPVELDDVSRRYILCHERAHISHRDYLVKWAGYLMVMLHWFNPLAWVSFYCLCSDMEMVCDERVLKILGPEERKPYSLTLLKAAERRRGLPVLAFGESSTKRRIRNILNYRKPRFWVTLLLVVLLICGGIGLATNPVAPTEMRATAISIIWGADGPTSIFLAGKFGGEEEPGNNAGTISFDQLPDNEWLANTTFIETFPGEENSGGISLDLATEDSVVFHGEFGLFAFAKEGKQWKLKMFIQGAEAEEIVAALADFADAGDIWSKDSIHMEDRLRSVGNANDFTGVKLNEGWHDFDANKMASGQIAVLGAYTKDGTARLIDLFYGFYDPEVQVFHQVYLFIGNGAMLENPKGEISRMRYQSEGIYAEEMPPGELSEDAKTIK